ncbi:hypothetical protein ABZY14_13735 [Streptomyces sp. NPDC006617]|uniref:hypothetical protein n=1 Tax=Streptomyces sp. NPDC006617 TaxID=3155354 RepID=UPI0033A3F447
MRILREHGRRPVSFSVRALHEVWCPAGAARRTDGRFTDGRFTADDPRAARAPA